MGSHDPFGHLKHKLWPKERPWVKLAVWLPTTKSQELTWFPYVQVACNIPLEISRQGLQLCFRPHLNPRSAQKVMGPQSCESPSCENFKIVPWQNVIWMWALWRGTKYTIRGRWWLPSSPKPWWVLWIRVARGSFYNQKCSNYALITLCWFCAGLCE